MPKNADSRVSADLKYIVLSDVHLGAENSILTRVEPGTTVADTHVPSPALRALVECLAVLAQANAGGDQPTLIAAGDLIDLALSTPERALPVFGLFAEALMARRDPVVADEVVMLPGNHDHIIWEYTRERWLEDRFEADPGPIPADVARRTGPMMLEAEPNIASTLLTSLLRTWTGRPEPRMRVLYPDLALRSGDGRRAVLVTHGHYIDPVSTVMSAFLRLFAPQTPPPADAETLERENWPWIDFFFSSMTRSGKPGALIESIYDALQDPKALEGLVDVVAQNVTAHEGLLKGGAERWLIRSIVGSILLKIATGRERSNTTELLGEGARKALQTYISALRERLVTETGVLPGDARLIIGHTHKPFRQWWPDETWPGDGLQVFNTGGWVVDHFAPQPLAGGAVALVSDRLDVALLRMYQQIDDPFEWGVSVETVDGDAGDEAFAQRLRDLIDPAAAPWSTFSAAAAELVLERRQEMTRLLEGKLENLGD